MPGRKKYAPPLSVVKAGRPTIFLRMGRLGIFKLERSVVRADDRVALIAQLVKVPIIYPDVLRELELPDEARADDEGGDPALDPIVGRALR